MKHLFIFVHQHTNTIIQILCQKKAIAVKGKDILIRKAPLPLHFKIDQYMEDTGMQKRQAVLDLLEKATRNIKIKIA